jgi:hypothetical protein
MATIEQKVVQIQKALRNMVEDLLKLFMKEEKQLKTNA